MQNPEISNAHRQLTVTAVTVTKEDKVTGAVHGLESPLALLHFQPEHIILVMRPVAASFPDGRVEERWGVAFKVVMDVNGII